MYCIWKLKVMQYKAYQTDYFFLISHFLKTVIFENKIAHWVHKSAKKVKRIIIIFFWMAPYSNKNHLNRSEGLLFQIVIARFVSWRKKKTDKLLRFEMTWDMSISPWSELKTLSKVIFQTNKLNHHCRKCIFIMCKCESFFCLSV